MSVTFEAAVDELESFTCYTLVDITNTGVNDPARALPYQQYQNLNTLIQCIGLRSQPLMLELKILEDQTLSAHQFGSKYKKGKARVWQLTWKSDRMGYFNTEQLGADASGLPIYAGLKETVELPMHVVETKDTAMTNTYFEMEDLKVGEHK